LRRPAFAHFATSRRLAWTLRARPSLSREIAAELAKRGVKISYRTGQGAMERLKIELGVAPPAENVEWVPIHEGPGNR